MVTYTRNEKLQCHVEHNTAGGLVVKTVRVMFVPSVGNGYGRSKAGLCAFRVTDRSRISSSRYHGHREFLLDCAHMDRATEDRA